MEKLRYSHRGQLLIELVVAIGIITVVLLGVVDLATRSIKTVSIQKDKDEAVRMINKQLSSFTNEILFDAENPPVDCPVIIPEEYGCSIEAVLHKSVEGGQDDYAEVTVTISWKSGDGRLSTSLSKIIKKNE